MTSLKSALSTTLDLPPCCIELSPIHPSQAFIGTYFLAKEESNQEQGFQNKDDEKQQADKSSQKRSGSIIIMKVTPSELSIIFTHPTHYGILDLHFSPRFPNIFCTANSTSSISLFRTTGTELDVGIELITAVDLSPSGDPLALALQFHPIDSHSIGVSLSNGQVLLVSLDLTQYSKSETVKSIRTEVITTHSLEAWTLAFTKFSPYIGVFSGSDDSTLRFQPLSFPSEDHSEEIKDGYSRTVEWKDTRTHQAGVTSILPLSPTLLLTGSYDDHIRLLHLPPLPSSRARVLIETDLGGGVWRLKPIASWSKQSLPFDAEELAKIIEMEVDIWILASCMYAGARLLRLTKPAGTEGWKIEIVVKMEEHESMNYGSDSVSFPSVDENTGELYVVSTSFYDKLVCLTHIPREVKSKGSRFE
jgi:diphthine methyl ester acylhydrolase